MLLPPFALPNNFPGVTQIASYALDPADTVNLKVTTLDIAAPNASDGFFNPMFSDPTTAFPGDATLGRPTGVQYLIPGDGVSTGNNAPLWNVDTLGGLPALELSKDVSTTQIVAYVIPFSLSINPDGFTYQTFGTYGVIPGDGTFREGYFTSGIPTLTALPSSGTATYTGRLAVSTVDAVQRDPGYGEATASVTVDFAAATVTISTTGTTNLSNNAEPSALPSPAPGLDFSGTLTYAAGSNTFSGAVTASNGMTGNVTGRFYGAGIPATTASKAVGSPPEVGGTFALFTPKIEAIQGAFGGK
jgi:hypothetical protein